MTLGRRDLLRRAAAAAALGILPASCTRLIAGRPSAAKLRFGYAAITWGGKDRQAIDDIADVGFPGIQLRSNILTEFRDTPQAVAELLRQHHLDFVAFSSGSVNIDPAQVEISAASHIENINWLRAAGGRYLQVTDVRPPNTAVTAEHCERLGKLLNEIGRRSADAGITLAYHPHMGTIGEKPADSARVLAASDPRNVKLLLDVAHYVQGGGDPVAAIHTHRDRLAFIHLKDVVSAPTTAGYGSSSSAAGASTCLASSRRSTMWASMAGPSWSSMG